MATTRLYYADAYQTRFQGQIIAITTIAGHAAIALDQSAFYPEGGGQPTDRGILDASIVSDVQSDADGVVWHVLEQPLTKGIGETVAGEIDWQRRFDHIQQHHGQHLLSAAFEQLYAMRTVAFHLGSAVVTIDIDTPELTPEQAIRVEELTNQVIWQNRPVLARFVSTEELASITLRKPPTVSGPIRVVSVPDFDHSACGGTHPHSTGGVGLLHIRRWERRGNTTRVEFLCGVRAVQDLRAKNMMLTRISSSLSIGVDDLEIAFARLRESEERTRKALAQAQEQLLPYEAREYFAQASVVGATRVVAVQISPRSVEAMRALTRQIADLGCIAIIGMASDKGHVIIARATEIAIDCNVLLKTVLAFYGGKGGGRPEMAQGGVADAAHVPAIVAKAIDVLHG